MSAEYQKVLEEFEYLTEQDIRACLSYAADSNLQSPTSNFKSPICIF